MRGFGYLSVKTKGHSPIEGFEMKHNNSSLFSYFSLLGVTLLAAALLAGCGGGSDSSFTSGGSGSGAAVTGTVSTTLSDPPTCKGPLAPSDLQFDNVWVTITEVRIHLSDDAQDGSSGWQTLAELDPPLQIDLLSGTPGVCILSELGVANELPVGNYQQIRLHLLANDADPADGPDPNACESVGGFNCAQVSGGSLELLNLSSQANTGLKIPPGQIAGGGLQLEEGQAADINIEFDACSSIVEQGDGSLRLLPTLHAGEVSAADTINGTLVKVTGVDTTEPFTDVTGLVFLEQLDGDNIGRVILDQQTSPTGSFSLCPVSEGTYDLVAAAMDGSTTYNATITLGVDAGTAVGDIPMTPEGDTVPGEINGLVTTQNGGSGVPADIKLSPLQEVDSTFYTIPTFGSSNTMFVTDPNGDDGNPCPDSDTDCFRYTLFVPASDAQVGTFDAGGTTYAPADATADVEYQVLAEASVPDSEPVEPSCTPSSLTAVNDDSASPLVVTAGTPVTAETLAFTGCTEPAP
jgi:hypothetical protein